MSSGGSRSPEAVVREIRRKTRRKFSPEEKIRIVLEGLKGEESISEICRREGITSSLYYRWSKAFLDAADGTPTDVVYVADNGMVGIGFTTPTLAQLQVINATGEAIYGSSNDGAGVAGFSQNNIGILGISNNGKAGSFVGEVYVRGGVRWRWLRQCLPGF
jgi:hypothetical protein